MKKYKLLSSMIALGTVITPIFTSVACAKKSAFGEFDALIKQDSINEFIELAKVPRPTFETKAIAEYLKMRVYSLGLGASWNEDEYRAGETKAEQAKSSGNCWFDIPASHGHDDDPGIILQGHIDMILDDPYEHGGSIEAVVDGNVMHSKNNQTSLGADNGIGIGLMLSIAKHRDEFVHGPIRCLMTSDEEKGVSGASWLPKDSDLFKDKNGKVVYKNVINVDSEKENQITISCADTCCFQFKILINGATAQSSQMKGPRIKLINKESLGYDPHIYSLRIYDLLGGHSANDINKNRLNAIGLNADVLWSINHHKEPTSNEFNLISIKADNDNNRICSDSTLIFVSAKNAQTLIQYYIDPLFNSEKVAHPDEKNMKYELREIVEPESQKYQYAFDDETTDAFADVLYSMPYGPYDWIDKTLVDVATSNNVGPVNIDANIEGHLGDQFEATFTTLIRSCKNGHSIGIGEYIIDLIDRHSWNETKQTGVWIIPTPPSPETTPAWIYEGKTKLYDQINNGYNELGLQLKTRNAHSWLECGYITKAGEQVGGVHIVSIGPRIESPHTINETLYLDSFNQVIHSIIETLKKPEKLRD